MLILEIDLAQGFYQVQMDEHDCHKTAFRVGPLGLYEFVRMPFGLCNSPSTFQRLMEACLGDKNFEILLLYLDDILIFSQSFDEHLERLVFVFDRLRAHNLKIKPSKCHFFHKEVNYLGHVVSEDGVKVNPDKIAVIKDWKTPQTEKDRSRIYPYLTNFYFDVLPFLHCCRYTRNGYSVVSGGNIVVAENICPRFFTHRKYSSCENYEPPRPG